MEDALRQRLREALEASKKTMKAVSLEAGYGETFMRDILERDRDPGITKLTKIADILGITVSDIVYGDTLGKTVPLVGYVGAGSEVIAYDDHAMGDGVRHVEAPPNTTLNTVAVQVRGDSMAGVADDGWLLYYDERQDEPEPDLIGKLCIVWLEDGRTMVKKLYKGSSPGYWSLLSTTTGKLEEDVRVLHAARVKWIKPT